MIPLFKVYMDKNAHKEVKKVLNSGFIGQGPKVEEFESELREYFGTDFISTVNAGNIWRTFEITYVENTYHGNF